MLATCLVIGVMLGMTKMQGDVGKILSKQAKTRQSHSTVSTKYLGMYAARRNKPSLVKVKIGGQCLLTTTVPWNILW